MSHPFCAMALQEGPELFVSYLRYGLAPSGSSINQAGNRPGWGDRRWWKLHCPADTTDEDEKQDQPAGDGQKVTRSVVDKRWADCEETVEWKRTTGVYLDSGFGETT